MKGVTLWNPYAFAMVAPFGEDSYLKTIETRSWPTNYRGPIAIHAAKEESSVIAAKKKGINLKAAYLEAMNRPGDLEAFRACNVSGWDDLPFGMIIGVGELVACVPTSTIMQDTARRMKELLGEEQWESDRQWGNFSPGRFLWHVQEMNRFPTPIPYRGAQGLYEVEGIRA